MDVNCNLSELQLIPEVYCSVSVEFKNKKEALLATNELIQLGISDIKTIIPKLKSVTILDFAIINYEKCWKLDDCLTKMFSRLDGKLFMLKAIFEKYQGEAYIDIAINQFGRCPEIKFSGANMEKIRILHANISVDIT